MWNSDLTKTDKVEVYLGIGSNIGDRKSNLDKAVALLSEKFGVKPSAISSYMETEPWGFESFSKFLNAAVRFEMASPDPLSILHSCKETEKEMGRKDSPEYDASGQRIYHSRIIDIDVLFIGDMTVNTDELTVPHPLAAVRDFVKKPLREVVTPEFLSKFDIFS